MCLGLFSSLQINSQDKSEPVKKKIISEKGDSRKADDF